MIKKYFFILSVLIFGGWGNTGHKIINESASLFLPPQFDFNWSEQLADHASDADKRKGADPTESPKHYIDIDNYQSFVDSNYIIQNYDSIVAKYGLSFVIDQGTLPWSIIAAVDSLQSAFVKSDFNNAALIAADLGHYVADAHMPLHITKNYNGQLSGQSGIHSRYESQMINRYSQQIKITADSISTIKSIDDYVFNFIYENYKYVDSVLAADKTAKSLAGSTGSDLYYEKLWDVSKNFTSYLFNHASKTFAELILTAWVNAGSPSSLTDLQDFIATVSSHKLYQNYPNPFNPTTIISWQSATSSRQTLKVYDILGNEVSTLVDEFKPAGNYEVTFNANGLASGVYFYSLKAGDNFQTNKMILMR